MNTKTSLTMTMKDASGQQNISRSLTDINPKATANELVAFTQELASLTTNTLVTTSKITKEELAAYDYEYRLNIISTVDQHNALTKIDDFNYTVDHTKLVEEIIDAIDMTFSIRINYQSANVTPYVIKDKALTLQTSFGGGNESLSILLGTNTDGTYDFIELFLGTLNAMDEGLVGGKIVIQLPSITYPVTGGTVAPAEITFTVI